MPATMTFGSEYVNMSEQGYLQEWDSRQDDRQAPEPIWYDKGAVPNT